MCDFFFVNGIAFIHSISRKIQFRTVRQVSNRSKKTILKEIRSVRKLYNGRGFRVVKVRGDGEFKGLEADISPIRLEIVPQDGHVPEFERVDTDRKGGGANTDAWTSF
jgi:hypothetical protein